MSYHCFRKYYQTETQNVDFSNDNIRQEINRWVSEQTNEKIKNLIAEPLDPEIRLILVNAIYFKGDWAKKFSTESTHKKKFYRSDGSSVDVDMMHMMKKFHMDYIDELNTTVLELPYKGESMSMVIFLPANKDGLAKLEAGLTASHLMNLRWNQRTYQEVRVALPRFNLEQSASLSETLSDMGMPEVFSGGHADLSKMEGTHNLFLSEVVHKAFIEVNEEGSEAAAATGGIVILSAPPTFHADHPFLFVIRCNRSKSVLFMGKMEDPPVAKPGREEL